MMASNDKKGTGGGEMFIGSVLVVHAHPQRAFADQHEGAHRLRFNVNRLADELPMLHLNTSASTTKQDSQCKF